MRMSRPKHLLFHAAIIIFAATGCVQYHYHQDAVLPGCGEPGVVRYGERCEVPPVVEGGEVFVQVPPAGTTREVIIEPPISSRVIVGGPRSSSNRPLAGGWQRRDPANIATTRVEGGVDDVPVSR